MYNYGSMSKSKKNLHLEIIFLKARIFVLIKPMRYNYGAAGWRRGNAGVCKTLMRGFDSRSGLLKVMLKKSAWIILTSLFLLFLTPTKITFSQELTFEKAYQNYTNSQQVYSGAFSDYQKAKAFYLKNKTLALKEDARKKGFVMLIDRDEVVKAYLAAVRTKILEAKGLAQDEEDAVLRKIDSELLWYTTHKESYKDSDSLEDLFNKSKEVESRYQSNTPTVFYDALFNLSLGEVIKLRLDHEEVFASIKESLNKGVAEGKLEIDPFDRWLSEIDSLIVSLKVNESNSRKEMAKLYEESSPPPLKVFNSAIDPFLYSTALLKQFNSFLGEFLTSINSQLK